MDQILENIKKKIVDPEIGKLKNAVLGIVVFVDYKKRICDVAFIDKDNSRKIKENIPFPKDGDGLFTQSLQAGDEVELSYRNQSMDNLYIATVYKRNKKKEDFWIPNGQDLPFSTDLF